MILLKIISFFPFVLLLFLFLLGITFSIRKLAYYAVMSILGAVVILLYSFIFAFYVNFFALILIGLWIFLLYLHQNPQEFRTGGNFRCLIGKLNAKKENFNAGLIIPLFFLNVVNLFPDSLLRKINREKGENCKKMINMLLRNGEGLLIEVQSKEADIYFHII